jgi:hypothetical protein
LCVFLCRCVRVMEAGGGAACCYPERVVRRFVLIRGRRKERSVPYRVARGTHGVLPGYSSGYSPGYSRGTHGVLARSSRTESTGEVLPYRVQWQRTKRCTWHGGVSPVQSVTHTLEHAQLAHKHAHSPSVSRSLRPSLPCGLRVLRAAHVRLCRSLARASSRSKWCVPTTGVLVQYVWTDANSRVAILGFSLRVFVVPLLRRRVATSYLMGTRGYSMHASSWYRVGTFFRSWYPGCGRSDVAATHA